MTPAPKLHPLTSTLAFAVFAVAVAALPAICRAAGAGIELNDKSTATDVGLPAYPGASLHVDKDGDKGALNLSLWGGSLGFKLMLVKYTSPDPVDKIAGFYRDAMGRYGTVLDCSGPHTASTASSDKKVLTCNKDDKAESGGRLYKVGTPQLQRIVSIKPVGGRIEFEMLKIEASQ